MKTFVVKNFIVLLILFVHTSVCTADPTVGAHVMSFQRYADVTPVLSSTAVNTQTTTSIIIGVGRGKVSGFSIPPSDNKGNSYAQLGTFHRYTNWTNSGTAVYVDTNAVGGTGHTFTVNTNDEVTLFAIEVLGGGKIVDQKWNEVLKGSPLTSLSVTTTGPATLIAFWWGDSATGPHTAVPNNGFTVKESLFLSGFLVQGAVATKDVSGAGTYDVTWTATPSQGAQLWLVAMQKNEDMIGPSAPRNLRAE